MNLFPTITAAHWRTAIQRASATSNPISAKIRKLTPKPTKTAKPLNINHPPTPSLRRGKQITPNPNPIAAPLGGETISVH